MHSTRTMTVDMTRERRKKWRATRLAWGLLLPSMIFLAVFTFYPHWVQHLYVPV